MKAHSFPSSSCLPRRNSGISFSRLTSTDGKRKTPSPGGSSRLTLVNCKVECCIGSCRAGGSGDRDGCGRFGGGRSDSHKQRSALVRKRAGLAQILPPEQL